MSRSLFCFSLLLVLTLSCGVALAASCHTTHASFYCKNSNGSDQYLGRRSVEADWDWHEMGCVPAGCEVNAIKCLPPICRYGCDWWKNVCPYSIYIEYVPSGHKHTIKSYDYACYECN